MLISLLLIALTAFGGMALTYLLDDDRPLLWRLSAGTVIGSAVFGLIAFVLACIVGFSAVSVAVSLVVTMLPLLLLRQRDISKKFGRDWARAKGRFEGANANKLRRFAYYAFFFILFWLYFDRAVYEMVDGIYTGGSQNLGDLPFHLGAIFSFTEGNNFPPLNPSFAGAKFSYPFMADFLSACMMRLGAGFENAIAAQNLTWAFSLLVILEAFVVDLTRNRLAGRIAPALLFFTGGLGFLWFFSDAGAATNGFWDLMWHLPRDYTIGEQFRWGNSMVVLFITQRGLLLGMPLTILVCGYLWKIFRDREADEASTTVDIDKGNRETVADNPSMWGGAALSHFLLSPFLVGLLAGTLVLIHVHSLAVLFIVTAFLFFIRPEKWREWIAFGVGVAVIAVPELIWTMTGSATETSKFFGWHFGWDKRDENVAWFWLKNTGIFIPVLAAAVGFYMLKIRKVLDAADTVEVPKAKKEKKTALTESPGLTRGHIISLLLFYIPFAVLFVISNIAKFAPWEWDNIKILIYWFVGSLPLVALLIAWVWERNDRVFRIVAGVCFGLLVFSGGLDVWRTVSGYVQTRVFDAEAVAVAEQIKRQTAPNALFLNAPTYNSAVVLSGRPSLMRYSGHLSSYGIDYGPRENDVKQIYSGGGVADILLKKYDIEYVLVSPEERNVLKANEEFFKKYPVAAEAGQYRVYKVK